MGHTQITIDVLFTLQTNLLFSVPTIDSFIVFSGCFYIRQLNLLPSSVCSIGNISFEIHLLTREVGTKRMNKLTWSEQGLATNAQTWCP